MIKSELIQKIANANQHLYHRDIERIVNVVFNEIVEALARGDRVELGGFGAFTVKHRGRAAAAIRAPARPSRWPRSSCRSSRPARTCASGSTATRKTTSRGSPMLRRIVWLLVALPAALLLVTLAVVNRHDVRLVLDPFRPDKPVLSLVLPFYVYLFGTLLLGVVLGGIAVWLTQARWRRSARVHGKSAVRWRAEVDRLTRERDAQTAVRPKQLAASR